VNWPDGDTASGGLGQPVAGVACNATSQVYHVHTHVSIFLNGEQLAVPASIGIVDTATVHCDYHIHTHNKTGIIHVEAPAADVFTLGQLFAIWGEPLSYTNVADLTGLPVTVYVTDNGVVTEYTGANLGDIELISHREVTIQIGTPITEIPNYTWAGS